MDTKGHILSDSIYMKCLGRGSVEGEIGPNCYENRVPFWGNGSALELDGGNGCTTQWIC